MSNCIELDRDIFGEIIQTLIFENNIDVIEKLIKSGVDLNIFCQNVSPLHYAIERGRTKIVMLLIQAGVDVNAKDKLKGSTPLHYTSKHHCVDLAILLLKAGANVDEVDEYEWTPLHYSAKQGDVVSVRALMAWGADTNKKNGYGVTPYDFANIEWQNKECSAHALIIEEMSNRIPTQ